MADGNEIPPDPFQQAVSEQEQRKLEVQRRPGQSAWMGLGMFGMIGWSVAVPTLLGVAFGVWLDRHAKQSFSWTLSLLLAGLVIGCMIAWNWVAREHKMMHEKNNDRE